MVLSIVIPCYSVSDDLIEQAEFAIAGYKSHGADEVIVVEDGGQYSETLRELADTYIYCQENEGFSKAVNKGWKLSGGDYTGIVNSDTVWVSGDLKDLCISQRVTSPNVISGDTGMMAGCFFVVPRTLHNYGMLNEDLKNFCSDTDYEWRMLRYLQRVDSVEIHHGVNQTLKGMKMDIDIEYKRDNDLYHKLIKEGKAHGPN